MKGYYVIIRGPLEIGRSTLNTMIAERLHGKYISMDAVLKEHVLDKSTEGKEIPLGNFLKADEIIFNETKEISLQEKLVAFDGNFYHKEQLDHLVENLGELYYAFTLKSIVQTCIERDRLRLKSYGEDAVRAVHGMVAKFDFGNVMEKIQKLS